MEINLKNQNMKLTKKTFNEWIEKASISMENNPNHFLLMTDSSNTIDVKFNQQLYEGITGPVYTATFDLSDEEKQVVCDKVEAFEKELHNDKGGW